MSDLTTPVIGRWDERRKTEVRLCTADLQLKAVRAFCRWLPNKGGIRLSPSTPIRPQTVFVPARTEFCDAATAERFFKAPPTVDF